MTRRSATHQLREGQGDERLSEFERIAETLAKLPQAPSWVSVPAGDDAAAFHLPGVQVMSVDACVEDVHFRWDWLSPSDIGYRAFNAALSDIAAMGAIPKGALFSIAFSPTVSEKTLRDVRDGFFEAATEHACYILGGNMSGARELSITTTVIGTSPGPVLRRSGAREGDSLWVTGTLGRAGVGRKLLEGGETAHPLCNAWRRPKARVAEGLSLQGLATAAIDISDGFAQDLSHLCQSSRVGASIDIGKLPIAEHVAMNREESLQCALHGGEDYELIFTVPKDASPPPHTHASKIGTITSAEKGISFYQHGHKLSLPSQLGFRH